MRYLFLKQPLLHLNFMLAVTKKKVKFFRRILKKNTKDTKKKQIDNTKKYKKIQ